MDEISSREGIEQKTEKIFFHDEAVLRAIKHSQRIYAVSGNEIY